MAVLKKLLLGLLSVILAVAGLAATIVRNDQLMNRPSFDGERDISDIIYFATAIPNGE